MAWRWIDDKPLSEPMLARFTDAYMRHYDELNAQYRDLSNLSELIEVLSDNKVLREMCKQRRWLNIRFYSAQLELGLEIFFKCRAMY